MLYAIKRLEDAYEKVDEALQTATGLRAERLARTKEAYGKQIMALYDYAIRKAT